MLSNPNGAQALTTDHNVQGRSNQALPGNSQIQMPILDETT
ncbi:FmtB-protein [Staphylococcus aureus]|nr:FmtB-protein [Staphylococcus aureus]